MPGCLGIFIWRTAGVIWDSLRVHEQSMSLNSRYNWSILVHYHFWVIVGNFFFNIVFIAALHYGMTDPGEGCKNKPRYTWTISGLSNWMISIKLGVNVIQCFSHLITAYESWNSNSSMVQWSCWCPFYFQMIPTKGVDGIAFQCRLAAFAISNKSVMRC